MISLIESGNLANTENNPMIPRSAELVGLSTDTKPTGMSVGNGWSFIEMDTGKVFFYDAESENWLEFAGSGGGGGQGGNNVLVVNLTIDGATATADKTWREIYDAPYAVVCMEMGVDNKSFYNISALYIEGEEYGVSCVQPGNSYSDTMVLKAATETDYPSITMG